jgi:signal transduction histidine kinase
VLAAADAERRRVVRDLHDGAQQRLVHTVITLKLARAALDRGEAPAALVVEALENAELATAELRDLAHGILPAALARGGLRAGVESLVERMRLPVTVDVTPARVAATVEATAYFVAAEALTNTVKHAGATRATVSARVERGALVVEVRDDGVGGARIGGSTGLLGLEDRVAALSGGLTIDSPLGRGTAIRATLPLTEEAVEW